MAEALVDQAVDVREARTVPAQGQTLDPKAMAAKKRAEQLLMLAKARSGEYESKRSRRGLGLVTGPLGFALSGKIRFLAGALLLAGFVMWLQANGIRTPEGDVTNVEQAQSQASSLLTAVQTIVTSESPKQLSFPIVGPLLSSLGAGIAGAILLGLGLFRGWKMSLFAWPAALLALFMASPLGYAIAGGLAVVGLVFGRTSEE